MFVILSSVPGAGDTAAQRRLPIAHESAATASVPETTSSSAPGSASRLPAEYRGGGTDAEVPGGFASGPQRGACRSQPETKRAWSGTTDHQAVDLRTLFDSNRSTPTKLQYLARWALWAFIAHFVLIIQAIYGPRQPPRARAKSPSGSRYFFGRLDHEVKDIL